MNGHGVMITMDHGADMIIGTNIENRKEDTGNPCVVYYDIKLRRVFPDCKACQFEQEQRQRYQIPHVFNYNFPNIPMVYPSEQTFTNMLTNAFHSSKSGVIQHDIHNNEMDNVCTCIYIYVCM